MAYVDDSGNTVEDPPPDQSGADQIVQGAPPPMSPAENQIYGGGYTDQSGSYNAPTPGFVAAPAAPQAAPMDTSGLASSPQPSGPGPSAPTQGPAPSAPSPGPMPTAQTIYKSPDYSGIYQAQLEANAKAQQALLQFEQDKWKQDFGLRQQQYQSGLSQWQQDFGLKQQQFGLEQQKFDTSKQQFQQEFDLKTTIAKADQAYKEALARQGDVNLAQQAMRDAMTRDFQQQELGFRNQQLAQQTNIEREKLDLQRRLLPVTRTARRAATVTTI